MSTTRRLRVEMLCRVLPCIWGSLLLSACSASSSPDAEETIRSGIWMFSDIARERDGETISCRPMLMEVSISDTTVKIGERAFPCAEETDSPPPLTLERRESLLYFHGAQVGTFEARKLEVTLPDDQRKISWNMDRADAPWQETGTFDAKNAFYSAKPVWRPDDHPVPIAAEISGEEDKPVSGWAHAATLPGAVITYLLLYAPQKGYMDAFDTSTGKFRILPDPNFDGRDEIRFFVTTGDWHSLDVPVGIEYTSEPDPPIVNPSFWSTSEDTPLTFTPDAIDPDGDPLTFEVVTPPLHGQVQIDGTSITYTPDTDFNGSDSLEYAANDGTSTRGPASINIFVASIDDPAVPLDQTVYVPSESATPITLQAFDVDSPILEYLIDSPPSFGQLISNPPLLVYVPTPGVKQEMDFFTFRVFDGITTSDAGTVNIIIEPGTHPSTLLSIFDMTGAVPEITAGSNLYFRTRLDNDSSGINVTDGSEIGTVPILSQEPDTFGFDNNIGGVRRTIFFQLGSYVYYTTSTKALALQFYRSMGQAGTELLFQIPPPANVASEPAIGEAYIEGSVAYFPVYWRTTNASYACQVWKTDANTTQVQLAYSFPEAQAPCSGLWTLAGEQYMFVGSSLYKFSGMQAPPSLVKDLGNALATPWMTPVGSRLFFQTRTQVGAETQIDLWVTDGTNAGTNLVKQLESAVLEFDVFSPTVFANKLYFAHRKSLWSSDGTPAGTNIVSTIPVSSVIGNGAIGKISVSGGRMYFLATSDAAGREPWTSDGTAAGTKLLRDIHIGTAGSSTASTNPSYFQSWNGQVFFVADNGGNAFGLWSTDGTSAGTKLFEARRMTTIWGILGDQLIFDDGHHLFGMSLL